MRQIVRLTHPTAEQVALYERLVTPIFGISFARWSASGQWMDRYAAYLMLEDGEPVSNVSVFFCTLHVDGRRYPAAQLGAVATRPDRRGQGLASQLMRKVLSDLSGRLVYLAANKEALSFYPRFGFAPANDYTPTLAVEPAAPTLPLRRLDLDSAQDMLLAYRMVMDQKAFSGRLDVSSMEQAAVWHFYNSYPKDVYYCPPLQALLCLRKEGDATQFFDARCARPLTLEALLPAIQRPDVARIDFHFTPDWLGAPVTYLPREDSLFVRGAWTRSPACLPALSIT